MPPSELTLLGLVRLFFFSSRRRHTRSLCDWSSDVCSSDLLSRSDRSRFAASLLDAILGGSASSRLFQEIREKRGMRSEERRVGKECRTRRSPYHQKKR